MDTDSAFRLKAVAVFGGVLGVFLVAFVVQRVWVWMKTRRREDIEASRMIPVVDLSLLGIGAIVIWLAVEALVLAVQTAEFAVQPAMARKIAEIEVGKLDREAQQTNLLFYPVDRAGRRQAARRRPVLTSGDQFELKVQVIQWRGMWSWLGQGYYQFVSLGGFDSVSGVPATEVADLDPRDVPGGVGGLLFLARAQGWESRQPLQEGQVYDVLLDPASQSLQVRLHEDG